jgi:hypothetical protein
LITNIIALPLNIIFVYSSKHTHHFKQNEQDRKDEDRQDEGMKNTFEYGQVGLPPPTPHTSPKGKRTSQAGWGKSSGIRSKTFDVFKTQGMAGKTWNVCGRIGRRGKGERVTEGKKEEVPGR